MRSSLILLIILTFKIHGYGQELDNPKAIILKVFNEQASELDLQKCNSVEIKYRTSTTALNGVVTNQTFHMFSNNDRSVMKTKAFDVYQDSLVTVNIYHEEKEIQILPGVEKSMKEKKMSKFLSLDATLLKHLKVIDQKQEEASNVYSIKMKPKEDKTKLTSIETYQVRLNMKLNQIIGIDVSFKEGESEIKEFHLTVDDIIKDVSAFELTKPIIEFILNSEGKIMDQYKDYTVSNIGNLQLK